jgi:Spy/CpxP family protein refolding chaperone
MSHFCKRFFMIAAAVCVLLPLGAMAQQEQGTAQGQGGSDQTGQQTPGRMGRGARYRHAQRMLAKRLNLTDDQKQQFQQIGRKARQQAEAIRNDSSLSDADKKQKLQDLRKQTMQQRIGVLTPEQQEELKKIREERRKEHGQDKTSQNKEDDDDIFAGMTSDDGGPTTSPLV